MDGNYLSDGAGEPYTAGRGESDDVFRYYSRHPLPRVGAPTGRPGIKAATPVTEAAFADGPPSQEATTPVAMTCMQCHGGACMYQSPSAEPFCVDCNRAALQR
jgi:hypothetical protein